MRLSDYNIGNAQTKYHRITVLPVHDKTDKCGSVCNYKHCKISRTAVRTSPGSNKIEANRIFPSGVHLWKLRNKRRKVKIQLPLTVAAYGNGRLRTNYRVFVGVLIGV